MVYSCLVRPLRSFSPAKNPPNSQIPISKPSKTSSPFPIFSTFYNDNLRYLKSIGIINSDAITPQKNPSPETLSHILSTVNFLKSHGCSDSQFPRIAYHVPQIFSPRFDPDEVEPVFNFLRNDLAASEEESCALIHFCPQILHSHVQFCLKPTLHYLTELGLQNLNSPTKLNAHLLNTRIQKLEEKVKFLRHAGFSWDETAAICVRFPAIFGYSVENNLMPKLDYLVREMERSVYELNEFPQYFAYSLEKRIMPRHMHLKKKNVQKFDLQRMLLWTDKRFYAKWK
ncbi:OLC1v1012822C1 [Oldenlandia corymbosa var. corymbosa]|uniref:OLC1v1012822C1 n=1 Tax=Oldenlandia corymbosa var. corymbosa TaxID=529605 RepID=A0AAV1DWW1_OLDCO|nr:OLC1v1012822C1 [Oldenlandia corymbosa var. corymbosa]